MRNIRASEKMYLCGLGLILLFMLIHDWVPLGSLNDVEALKAENTTGELIMITLINTLSISIMIAVSLLYTGKRYPIWARLWLIIHLGFILYGAVSAWWIPYFFGADLTMIERYGNMFGNTHAFLPVMNGLVPNTIHVMFHAALLLSWLLAVYISITQKRVNRNTHFPDISRINYK